MSVNIRVLYGTETGNAEECAHEMGDALEEAGHTVTVTDMGEFQPSDLSKEALAVIITSTYNFFYKLWSFNRILICAGCCA